MGKKGKMGKVTKKHPMGRVLTIARKGDIGSLEKMPEHRRLEKLGTLYRNRHNPLIHNDLGHEGQAEAS